MFANVTLIDGTGGTPLAGATVIVAGERIREVLPPGVQPSRRQTEPGSLVYDLGAGMTLIPGLLDAHVHLGHVEVNSPETYRRMPFTYQVGLALRRAEQTLMQGFTTVRDAGGIDAGIRDLVAEGKYPGPRILVAGRVLSQTGGHGDRRWRSERGAPPEGPWLPVVADGVAAVRRAVREEFRRGVDHFKVIASGGAASASDKLDSAQYSIEELRAAVEEAEDQNRYVMAHAYSGRAVLRAAQAGVRSVEHGNLLDERAAETMRDAGTYLVPTMITYEALLRGGERNGLEPHQLEKLRQAQSKSIESLQIAYRVGVRIGSGSDLLGEHHAQQAAELALKARVMTPMEAIVSATRINAELLELHEHVGTIRPGKLADLLIIRGNPLTDLTILQNTDNIRLIMKGGAIYKDELSNAPYANSSGLTTVRR